MTHDWPLYIAAFACAFALSLFMTPFAKKISIRLGAIDKPKKRGMHSTPIPRLGGIAIVFGFMGAMFILFPFTKDLQTPQFAGLVIGSIIIVVLGIVDDIYDLRASVKLCVQIVAAAVAVFSGIRMNVETQYFQFFFNTFSIPITFLWIIGLTNAVNLIDGLDGLAAGVSSIASLCIMVLCALTGSGASVFFAAALAGACLGFLPRNFNPAEIIMGDCGATFLGYVLAVTSIMGLFKGYALLSCMLAALVLAFPILDTAFAIIRRALNKQPILRADRGHLHHRLIDRGISHKSTVLILYAVSFVCGATAILFSLRSISVTIVVLIFFLILCSTLFVYRSRVDKTLPPAIPPLADTPEPPAQPKQSSHSAPEPSAAERLSKTTTAGVAAKKKSGKNTSKNTSKNTGKRR